MEKDKVFSMLKSLKDMGLKRSMHELEQESGLYFNLEYFKESFIAGDWTEVESYLSSFTKFHDSSYIFLVIWRHKHTDAVKRYDEDLYKGMLKDQFPPGKVLRMLGEHNEVLLKRYGNTDTVRERSLEEVIEIINHDPNLRNKLDFPTVPPLGPLPLPVVASTDTALPLPAAAQPSVAINPAHGEGGRVTRSTSRQLNAGPVAIPATARQKRSSLTPLGPLPPLGASTDTALPLPAAAQPPVAINPAHGEGGRVTRSTSRQLNAGPVAIPATAMRKKSSLTPLGPLPLRVVASTVAPLPLPAAAQPPVAINPAHGVGGRVTQSTSRQLNAGPVAIPATARRKRSSLTPLGPLPPLGASTDTALPLPAAAQPPVAINPAHGEGGRVTQSTSRQLNAGPVAIPATAMRKRSSLTPLGPLPLRVVASTVAPLPLPAAAQPPVAINPAHGVGGRVTQSTRRQLNAGPVDIPATARRKRSSLTPPAPKS